MFIKCDDVIQALILSHVTLTIDFWPKVDPRPGHNIYQICWSTFSHFWLIM